ncbi:3-phosphoinositide dependent protein kinase-1 [Cichlidogyrus casuarinus]|uniref:3-phosphoinositide-dependent protein kinase 1 n=1 Tax=Cichlidogyrus casuarinus TaxID=1844966 RepID=A0ABD2QK14_9PLAT
MVDAEEQRPESSEQQNLASSDFKFMKEIGHGSFSNVFLAKEIRSNNIYAVKVIEKSHALKNNAVSAVLIEKEVLVRTSHPFIIQLYYTFQDQKCLYYVLQYAELGDMQAIMQKLTSLDLNCTQFFAAEVLLAIEHLHSIHVVHRDIKPENILLTSDRHIKIADFGSAIITKNCKIKAQSFTGSPQYVSPEMIAFMSQSFNVNLEYNELPKSIKESLVYCMDFWSLGCVIYQFLSGHLPFGIDPNDASNPIYEKILKLNYQFPDSFDSTAQEIVKAFLVTDPRERLGCQEKGGIPVIKSHKFFQSIDWEDLPKANPPHLKTNIAPLLSKEDWDQVPAGYEAGRLYMFSMEVGLAQQLSTMDLVEKYRISQKQYKDNPFNRFAKGRIIIKQGILYKRRGLFAKKRMFILTEGPHLFYVDPDLMELKGEVPFVENMKLQITSLTLFSINMPNRNYYLEDPTNKNTEWIQYICRVYKDTFGKELEIINS